MKEHTNSYEKKLRKVEENHPPIAPRRTASDCFAAERVSSGKGTPVKSKAAPPMGISWNLNSIPNLHNTYN